MKLTTRNVKNIVRMAGTVESYKGTVCVTFGKNWGFEPLLQELRAVGFAVEQCRHNNQFTVKESEMTTKKWLEAAVKRFGSLERADNRRSARIWLQGKLNQERYEYAAGRGSVEEIEAVEAAFKEVAR